MTRLRWWRRHDEIPVSELGRTNPVRFAIVLLLILIVGLYFGFTKHIPFKHGFKLNAVFNSAVNIKGKSPVRIAGVDVGHVTRIHREGNTGVVNMEIDTRGLNCPLPILRAKKALADMASGQVLKIVATDPGSVRDFQAFAKQTGNQLVAQHTVEREFVHYLKRR